MAFRNKEIEIKVSVEKPEKLVGFLNKNAKHVGRSKQLDEYFVPAHRNFISAKPIKEWLRLRSEDNAATLNYKNWIYDKRGLSVECKEFESKVSDPQQLKSIFSVLNFRPIVKVDKVRDSWIYKEYEISVDEVEGLGAFVEIEFRGKSGNSKKTVAQMIDFLKSKKVGKIRRNYQGYPFLLLFPRDAKYLGE